MAEMNTELAPINAPDVEAGDARMSDTKVDTVLSVVVPDNCKHGFLIWLEEIYELVLSVKGFRTRHVERLKAENGYTEYVVVLVFDDLSSQRAWMYSPERVEYVARLESTGVTVTAVCAYGEVDGSGGGGGGVGGGGGAGETQSRRIFVQESLARIPKPLPPPKWKLALLLATSVYFTVLLVIWSGQILVMREARMPAGLFLFIVAAQVVTVLVYGILPLVMSAPLVSGWLKAPRSCPAQMHPLHRVMDQGLQMFALKMSTPTTELFRRLDTLDAKMGRLREVNHRLNKELRDVREAGGGPDSQKGTVPPASPPASASMDLIPLPLPPLRSVKCSSRDRDEEGSDRDESGDTSITMAVRHYVKWECVLDFELWTDQIETEMGRWEGFRGLVRIAPKEEGGPYINSFTFLSYAHLKAFSASAGRDRLLRRLGPLLEATSQAEVTEERTLGDAFTELLVPTGGAAALRPPPIWKTVTLSIIGLHIIIWQVGYNLTPYLLSTGMSPLLSTLITSFINVFLNSYIGLPLMQSQFGEWLRMPRTPPVSCSASVTGIASSLDFLDVGLSRWGQLALVTVYYGTLLTFSVLNWPPY